MNEFGVFGPNNASHWLILSGQSKCGKSAVTKYFEQQGFCTIPEAATPLFEKHQLEKGCNLWDQRYADQVVFEQQHKDLKQAQQNPGITVLDRTFIDTQAFETVYPDAYDPIVLPEEELHILRTKGVKTIFFLMPPPGGFVGPQDDSGVRNYDKGKEEKIAKTIQEYYKKHGFYVEKIDWVNAATSEEAIALKAQEIHKRFQRRIDSERDIAVIQQTSQQLKKNTGHTDITVLEESEQGSKYFLWCVEKNHQTDVVDKLRQQLLAQTNTRRVVQFVGDCELFSEAGTQFAMEKVEPYVSDAHNLLTFGHSGLFNYGAKDVNGIVIASVEHNFKHSGNAHTRLVSNVVDQCVSGIENWGYRICKSPVNQMVVVYNQDGKETKFGDDCDISDKIMQKSDVLLVLEGGPQSLLQILNALNQNATVEIFEGLREIGSNKFSAANFLRMVRQQPNISIEEHFENEKKKEWKESKREILDKVQEMLQNPELQQKIRSTQVSIEVAREHRPVLSH
ncbi:MAG TPA: AAA family ATPase [Gammaproteobacteria bacterium]|nr:AAA family ATPase [Gammaproteobacteria bacterium]